MKKIILIITAIIFFSIPVSADGIEDRYTQKLENIVTEYEIDFDKLKENPFETLYECVKKTIKAPIDKSLNIVYKTAGVLLLTSFINLFSLGNNDVSKTINTVAVAVIFYTVFDSVLYMIHNVSDMLFDVKNFMTVFLPVFGGISFAAGEVATSALYTGFFLVSVISVANFCVNYILPSVNLYLAVGITSQVSSVINLKPLCEFYTKTVKTAMTATVSVLCFVLSLQTVIAQGKDGLVLKAGKMIVTSTVPIIGSALESAVGSVYASMGVLKGFCGIAGVAVIISIFMPHIVSLAWYWICCQLMIVFGAIIENKLAQELLAYFKDVIEILISMCVLFLILLVFSVTVMIKATGV